MVEKLHQLEAIDKCAKRQVENVTTKKTDVPEKQQRDANNEDG
jgi:hypothetical protein